MNKHSGLLRKAVKAVQFPIQQQVKQQPKVSRGASCTHPCTAPALSSRKNPFFPNAKDARPKRGHSPGSRQDRAEICHMGNYPREEAVPLSGVKTSGKNK